MPDSPLVVPIHCDVLAANATLLQSPDGAFRWWQFNYMALSEYKSPEPAPVAMDHQNGTPAPGVFLQWTLPRGLRHGEQNNTTGTIDYPLIPNRWLVVRLSGSTTRGLKAWVLESDCPVTTQTNGQWSLYLPTADVIRMWKASSDSLRNSIPLDPASTDVQTQTIGVQFPLSQGWSERAPNTMFLTAVAPSNPVFSAYYAHNSGVLAFYDDVTESDAVTPIAQDTLSYFIAGWYSDPAQDILAKWPQDKSTDKPFEALLDRLNWQMIGGAETQPTSSLYHAAVFSLPWDRNGVVPAGDPLRTIRESKRPLDVAVGNTTIDAFTALIAAQTGDQQKADLLRAFQYDFLPLLNQPNGEALLAERIRQEWFGMKPGGYSWTIVSAADGSVAPQLSASEAQWLAKLNSDQRSLDIALNELFSLQWDLNSVWYKAGWLSHFETFGGTVAPDGLNADDPDNPNDPLGLTNFQAALTAAQDPAQTGSLAARTLAQIRTVKSAMSNVPQPDWTQAVNAQDAFEQGIQTFAARQNISPSNTLKAISAPRFARTNNPVVFISGVEPSEASDPNQAAQVRLVLHLVTSFEAGGKTIDAAAIAAATPALPNAASLPATVASLYTEFLLLDPASASAIATAVGLPPEQVAPVMSAHAASTYQGTLPGLDLTPWAQPWNPMFLEWQGSYFDIPYQANGNSNWLFDGTDYSLAPQVSGAATDARVVGGISPLGPHAQFIFAKRLAEFVKKYGKDTEIGKLDEWIEQIFGWKFLAQELIGFNELLALRSVRTHRRPVAADTILVNGAAVALADVLGYRLDASPTAFTLPSPYRGQVQDIPFIPNGPVLPFHGVRQGQFYFTDLIVYDAFGRMLTLISSGDSSGLFDYKNFPVLMDGALRPATKLDPTVNSVIQLPPRALQHARLDFALVDARNDQTAVEIDPAANPVCGFILPNHLDHSILIYAPDGTSLGEYRLLETAEGHKVGTWQPPPHRDITLADVGTIAPRLAAMLGAQELKQEANFRAFLSAIDSTLWTVDPLGNRSDQNLSVLIGRPLALVRARLQFQLDGRPLRDTGWAATFDSADPEFVQYLYSIRLGDQATRQDGVIGYYAQRRRRDHFGTAVLADDYTRINSVAAPDTTVQQTYVTPIGPLGTAGGGNYINLSFKDGSAAYITLLLDPRASAHAVTGILPVKQLDIPARFIDRPLANMEASFRMGPILTFIQPTPGQTAAPQAEPRQAPPFPTAITYPLPSEQNGAWSWWETNANATDASPTWTGYDLVNATANAQLKDVPITAREGFFQIVLNKPKT